MLLCASHLSSLKFVFLDDVFHRITSTFITFTSLFHSSLENLHKFPVEKLKVKFFIEISKHISHQKYNIQVLRRASNECLIILFTNFFLTLFFQASVLDLLFVEWSELPNQFLTFGVIRLMKRVEWILPALWVASKFPKELHLWVENTFLKDNRCLFLDFNHFHEVLNST